MGAPMATSRRALSPLCTSQRGEERRPSTKKTRAASGDAALISAIHLPKGSDRSTQRATCSTLAPSFIGACATSLRQAPRATAAMTAARTIAPFIGISVVSFEPDRLTRYLTSDRQICAELHRHGFLTAASRQRNSGHEGRNHQYVLDVHVFSPKSHRATSLPVHNAQIKNATACPRVFHVGWCEIATSLMHAGQPRCAYSQSAHTWRRVAHRRNRAVLAA